MAKNNKQERVRIYAGEKPENFSKYYYDSTKSPKELWEDYQKMILKAFPLTRRVKKTINRLKWDFNLTPHTVLYLEDCFRGFSPQMQGMMCLSLENLICSEDWDYIPTGSAHVDDLISEIANKIYKEKYR